MKWRVDKDKITGLSERVYEYAAARDFYHMEGSVEEVKEALIKEPYSVIEYLLNLLDEQEA